MMCGGHSAAKQPCEQTIAMVAALEKEICEQLQMEHTALTLKEYTSQVVAGTNYTFTLEDGQANVYKVVVFKALPHTGESPKVTSAQKL